MSVYHTIHFGCRANQADGAALERELASRGFRGSTDAAEADVVILNSCTVTGSADADLRQSVRRIHRGNPRARILVTGCYAQRRPEEIAGLPGVEWVVGNSHKHEIGRLLDTRVGRDAPDNSFVSIDSISNRPSPGVSAQPGASSPSVAAATLHVGEISHQRQFAAAPFFGGAVDERTRPNLKIQDGCNSRCSFCIIPSVRGLSRSLPVDGVLREMMNLCAAGYREIVITGVNLGQYGLEWTGKIRFPSLLRRMLEETPVEKIRLSSVEPMDFTDELLDLMAATDRIAPHIHAPLQSGSDRILRAMHRKYKARDYRERLLAAAARMPNAGFGADVMVGFPGETAEDFEQTRALIDSLPFTYLHVFPFSPRPGTPAERMPGQVRGDIARERGKTLRELVARKNLEFRRRQTGTVLTALTLEDIDGDGTLALSDNYLKIVLPRESLPPNRWVRARITGLGNNSLVGEIETATGGAAVADAAHASMMT